MNFRRIPIFAAGLALVLISMQGCGSDTVTNPNPTPGGPTFNDANSLEPTAGTWKTYSIASGASLRPAAPPALGSQTEKDELTQVVSWAALRTDANKANIDFWNGGTARRWNEYLRELIEVSATNPPRASRAFALLSVGMYDALVASYDAKYYYRRAHPAEYAGGPTVYGVEDSTPSYVSERAAMSRAACDILVPLFPAKGDSIIAMYNSALEADQYSGTHFPSDINAGFALGAQVAAAVNARAAGDGAGNITNPAPPVGPGHWVPTPPAFIATPQEPNWGNCMTWAVLNGQAMRPGTPPALGAINEFNVEVHEVYDVNQSLTPERLNIAHFWADGSGSWTPPGHWNAIGVNMGVSTGLDEPRMARMLALLGMAQADAFICCWDCKYAYWSVRPVTAIRDSIDASWLPPIVTPAFPSYPSGHSTTSGAASTVLGYIFPDSAEVLRQMGTQAMNSRLFGGIHFGSDNITGLNMGSVIGARVVQLANRDGSPKPSVRWRGWTAARFSRPTAMPVPARGRLTDMAD